MNEEPNEDSAKNSESSLAVITKTNQSINEDKNKSLSKPLAEIKTDPKQNIKIINDQQANFDIQKFLNDFFNQINTKVSVIIERIDLLETEVRDMRLAVENKVNN